MSNKQQTAIKLELTKEKLDKLYLSPPFFPEKETDFQRAYRMGRNALVLELIEKLTPIELPNDEEIDKASGFACWGKPNADKYSAFNDGAKWMRDKITGGDK